MDQKRKNLHEIIETAAKNKDGGSKWDLKFPIDIDASKKKFYPKSTSTSD